MATERQIAANRANAKKSTGPVTPEGQRISSQNRSFHKLLSGSPAFKAVIKGQSRKLYNAIFESHNLEFQPRDAAERALVETLTIARWRVLCARKIQNTALRREIAQARRDYPSDPSRATLAAIAFGLLAGNSNAFTRAHRLEVHYEGGYHRALAKLVNWAKTPKSGSAHFFTEPNLGPAFAPPSTKHLTHGK